VCLPQQGDDVDKKSDSIDTRGELVRVDGSCKRGKGLVDKYMESCGGELRDIPIRARDTLYLSSHLRAGYARIDGSCHVTSV